MNRSGRLHRQRSVVCSRFLRIVRLDGKLRRRLVLGQILDIHSSLAPTPWELILVSMRRLLPFEGRASEAIDSSRTSPTPVRIFQPWSL